MLLTGKLFDGYGNGVPLTRELERIGEKIVDNLRQPETVPDNDMILYVE